MIYQLFGVGGNESEALNGMYLELYELIGKDAMLKLYKYYRGDKIDGPMRLYRLEFIADIASKFLKDESAQRWPGPQVTLL